MTDQLAVQNEHVVNTLAYVRGWCKGAGQFAGTHWRLDDGRTVATRYSYLEGKVTVRRKGQSDTVIVIRGRDPEGEMARCRMALTAPV